MFTITNPDIPEAIASRITSIQFDPDDISIRINATIIGESDRIRTESVLIDDAAMLLNLPGLLRGQLSWGEYADRIELISPRVPPANVFSNITQRLTPRFFQTHDVRLRPRRQNRADEMHQLSACFEALENINPHASVGKKQLFSNFQLLDNNFRDFVNRVPLSSRVRRRQQFNIAQITFELLEPLPPLPIPARQLERTIPNQPQYRPLDGGHLEAIREEPEEEQANIDVPLSPIPQSANPAPYTDSPSTASYSPSSISSESAHSSDRHLPHPTPVSNALARRVGVVAGNTDAVLNTDDIDEESTPTPPPRARP